MIPTTQESRQSEVPTSGMPESPSATRPEISFGQHAMLK
jgi:hypothetical protein